jgi:hypothetical protein
MQPSAVSKKRLFAGRILSVLAVLFLLFDGVTKVMQEPHVMAASAQLGFSARAVVGIGMVLLVCTLIYAIPRMSVLGAILLTGYLGGATAIQARIGKPLFDLLFPIIFGVLIWVGIFLRENRLHSLIPLRK